MHVFALSLRRFKISLPWTISTMIISDELRDPDIREGEVEKLFRWSLPHKYTAVFLRKFLSRREMKVRSINARISKIFVKANSLERGTTA